MELRIHTGFNPKTIRYFMIQPLLIKVYNQVKVVVKGVSDMMFGGDGGN